jgi:8-oxo-dGTP pyrophosphatase MutT (NUDIX family)
MGHTKGMQRMVTDLIWDASALRSRIMEVLFEECSQQSLFRDDSWDEGVSSSVMLLLGQEPVPPGDSNSADRRSGEISIILNKRSRKVRQAGDLCCPGGMVETQVDPYLAKLLLLPGSPLVRWVHWSQFRRQRHEEARLLSLLLATGLRECWEEMRLNPLSIDFLGPLPPQRLLLFRRVIHPSVGWVLWRQRFVPSWEVEKIVRIPFRSLLNPVHYACYRLYVPPHLEKRFNRSTQDMPCFIHKDGGQTELLWGATYKIVTHFVELVFGFKPPELSTLPLIPGVLDEGYINGGDDQRSGKD